LGNAIEHLAAAFAWIAAGDGLQISQSLLAEAALVGLGAVLQQPVERFGQVADLERWHGAPLQDFSLLVLHALWMREPEASPPHLQARPRSLKLMPYRRDDGRSTCSSPNRA
jgi:hypothetical protein